MRIWIRWKIRQELIILENLAETNMKQKQIPLAQTLEILVLILI